MNQRRLRRIPLMIIGLAILTYPCRWVKADSQVVWQIGQFDESSHEFVQGPLFSFQPPRAPVLYIIGKSTPEKDWPAFQPGSANARAGSHPYPYTIQFDLPDAPVGVYTLNVALLYETTRIAQLRVEINGHKGRFYQHLKLNFASGDEIGDFEATYAAGTIRFDFPARFLSQGTNKLVLTAINEPATRDDTNSGIVYDAVRLDQDRAGRYSPGEVKAEAWPTVFYVRKGDGLFELIDLYVRHNAAVKSGEVTLTVGGQKLKHELASSDDLGEEMVEFSVPEFDSPMKAGVTVKINGHSQQFPIVLTPEKKWTVFAVPHEHLDIGYPDYQAKVAEVQSRALDEAIDLILQHPDFRYSPDAYWCAREFLKGRSPAQQQKLFQMIKDKKIFVPVNEASLLTGFPALETLIRSLYPGFQFNQQHGGDGDYADITDVPSYTWSYASIMAAAGLKYFFSGSDNGRGPILIYGGLNKSPFWWQGPDGGKILMWYSRGYSQVSSLFGLEPAIAAGHDSLPIFLQAYSHPKYKSDAVLLYGTQVENTDLFPQQAELAAEWNKVFAYPHIQYSGFTEALRYIAEQFGSSLPVIRGDGGPYWEDGIASTARSAALERQTEQRALAAEKFSTISALINPKIEESPSELRKLWSNMVIYDEHTWGADRSVSDPKSQESVEQLATKELFATDAKRDLDYVLERGLAGIADYIHDPRGTLVVFNPLSWQRSNLVEIDLDKGRELVNLETNQVVPYEELSTGKSYRHIRFLATDIPSVGYRAYSLKETEQEPEPPQVGSETILESPYYRVELDSLSGAVKSVFDKELNKELVNTASPYRLNQYLYVTGGDETPNRTVDYTSVWPIPDFSIRGAANGRIVSVTKQPFGTVARLESSGVNTPRIETEIIVFGGQKKIEFINHVHKTEVYTKEGVYFAFPFAMEHPRFRYEIQNGFVDPSHDQLPGAGKEWFSVQHWVAAEQDGMTAAIIPVDAPFVTFGDIARSEWPKDYRPRQGTIFSYVMNNYWFTNYAAGQGGEFTFRYVLTSGNNLLPAYLSRLGWEEMSPLEVDQITSQDKAIDSPRPLDSARSSFLQVDQPNVVLITWKMAEDGEGTVLRFVEVSGKESSVEVQTPLLDLQSAWMSDALERKQGALSVSPHGFGFSVKPFQIVTVRLEGTSRLK